MTKIIEDPKKDKQLHGIDSDLTKDTTEQVAQASLWSAVPDAPLISFGIVVLR